MKYDWKLLQQEYDSGLTWRELYEKYGVCTSSINKAIKRNRFKSRNKSEAGKVRYKLHGSKKLSEETKLKISKSRIKYLQENPDKVPYIINHSSKESYPERIFRQALESSQIVGWTQKYRSGIYEYDFAFPEQKIDIEIDGSTHNQEKVLKIDARRDEWSKENGWTVLRFTAKQVKENVVSCINEVLRQL